MIERPSSIKLSACLALLTFAVAGCDQGTNASDLLSPGDPGRQIAHGGEHHSDSSFVFLDPIVKNSTVPDAFNPDLAPNIAICEIANTSDDVSAWHCVQDASGDVLLRHFGPSEIVVETDRYKKEWKLDDPAGPVEVGKTYRITVRVGNYFLGHADVVVGDDMKEAKNMVTGDLIPVNDDRTLVIAFHAGDVMCPSGADCFVGTVPSTGGTVVTDNQQAMAVFDDGWYDAATFGDEVNVFIIERPYSDENPCIPSEYGVLHQGGLCYEYTTEPDVGTFLKTALIAQCQDNDVMNSPFNDIMQLGAWDEGEPLRVLPNASEPSGVLQCTTATAMNGFLGEIERYARTLFLPATAWASDTGLGATIDSFSRVGWMAPLYGNAWPGGSENKIVTPGESFTTNVQVRSVHEHASRDSNGDWQTSAPVEEFENGVDVTFTFYDAGGKVLEGPVTVTTATLDGAVVGIAGKTFTLPLGATGDHKVIADGELVDPVTFIITPDGGTVTGTTMDLEDGTAVNDTHVVLDGTTLGTTSNLKGNYFLSGVPAGVQVLRASKQGYPTVQKRVDVAAGQTATLDFPLGIGIINTPTLGSNSLTIGDTNGTTVMVETESTLAADTSVLFVNAYIEQGSVHDLSGGSNVECDTQNTGVHFGNATCTTDFTVLAEDQNLVAGSATLVLTLFMNVSGQEIGHMLDQRFIPITLVQ